MIVIIAEAKSVFSRRLLKVRPDYSSGYFFKTMNVHFLCTLHKFCLHVFAYYIFRKASGNLQESLYMYPKSVNYPKNISCPRIFGNVRFSKFYFFSKYLRFSKIFKYSHLTLFYVAYNHYIAQRTCPP